jgi:hypothetical protein
MWIWNLEAWLGRAKRIKLQIGFPERLLPASSLQPPYPMNGDFCTSDLLQRRALIRGRSNIPRCAPSQ